MSGDLVHESWERSGFGGGDASVEWAVVEL